MLKLTIETENQVVKNQINNAYSKAIEATNFDNFLTRLHLNLNDAYLVGNGGGHIWISKKGTGDRLAIIYK